MFFPPLILLGFAGLSAGAASSPWKTRIVDRFELTFYNSKKNFEDAKASCERNGAHLVKDDRENIHENITQNIEISKATGYWIGANNLSSNGIWEWTDGTPVNMNGSGQYQKWGSTEPNKLDTEKCVVVGFWEYNWFNLPCSNTNKYICQRVLCLPTIKSIEPQPCNSSLLVKWKPNGNGVGHSHRIEVMNGDKSSLGVSHDVTPISSETQHYMIKDLMSSSNYSILISGCTDDSSSLNVATGEAVTGGLPNSVTRPVLSKNCTVYWSWPTFTPRKIITGFEVTIQSSLVYSSHLSSSPPIKIVNITASDLSHVMSTLPNRKYSAKIQARTCAGSGPMADAEGVCVTEAGAPTSLAIPAISSEINADGTRTITLQAPDEQNGAISCVLVIVAASDNSSKITSKIDLVTLNSTTSNANNGQTIALAISNVKFRNSNSSNVEVKLGDGSTTTCDASDTMKQRRRKRSIESLVFVGENKPLENDKTYSIYTVSTTPVGNDILLQTSEFLSVDKVEETGGNSWTTPVAVVVALVCLLLLVAVVVILYKKKRNTVQSKRNDQVQDTTLTQETSGSPRPNQHELQSSGHIVQYENAVIEREVETDTAILLTKFEKAYKKLVANDSVLIKEQFENLTLKSKTLNKSSEFASNPSLKKKNRYKNILPYDDNRVTIRCDRSAYINASFINGFNHARKFIATQGPLPSTINDFWLMVVDQECRVIVMVAKCFEAGKKKCEKYWPDSGKTVQYGSVTVKNEQEIIVSGYVKRTITVKPNTGNEITVYQYQYLKWPDHGIPHTTSNIVRMHHAAMKTQKMEAGNAPIVVHCSAGAGRTGTFIGYDILFDEIQSSRMIDPFERVLQMRSQRVEMVQTCDQYILVHKLLIESYLYGETDWEASEIKDVFNQWQIAPGNSSSRFSKEFANSSKVNPIKAQKTNGSSGVNRKMNRNQEIIPYDQYEVRLNHFSGGHPAYINASWVEAYEECCPMIATQGPLDSTAEYFWTAVFDNKVNTIVMLTQLVENDNEQSCQYWPSVSGEELKWKEISVVLTEETSTGLTIERTFEIKKAKQMKIVRQFQYTGWLSNACPRDESDIVRLVENIEENVRTLDGAVALVHCSDGAGRTGTFCAIVNLIERLKCENRVDVLRAVKDLRDCRPGMVQTLDQYIFCYRAVIAYLRSFDIYSNYRKDE